MMTNPERQMAVAAVLIFLVVVLYGTAFLLGVRPGWVWSLGIGLVDFFGVRCRGWLGVRLPVRASAEG